jgi:L-ascorbate metabolism protein UlaG (beta-lactamase superfamily)
MGTLAVTGLGAGWIKTSRRRSARYLRQIIADARRSILPAPHRPDPATWSDNNIAICWLGHATVLINFYGVKILTDPALGNHIGLSLGVGTAGPKRYVAPALKVHELPPIDLVLLSHAHMDHMDVSTLRHFRAPTQIVTAKVTQDVLDGTRVSGITELGWNEQTRLKLGRGDLLVEAIEVKHWGRRWPSEEFERGYNGYILRREGKTLLFGGDTAQTPLIGELRQRGPFAAAIMPIGAYRPWINNHCTPEEAVEMANRAGAHYIVPIHHQTFRLSEEPLEEPLQRLEQAIEPERIALRAVGETFQLS